MNLSRVSTFFFKYLDLIFIVFLFKGAIQGPSEFAEGLKIGIHSLFSHTIGGAAGAVSKYV